MSDSLAVLDLWDELHAAASLQGIVNRDSPQLYLNYITNGGVEVDTYWWNLYRQPGQWLHGRDSLNMNTVERAVAHFRKKLRGAVVYDSNVPATSNIASSVAGVENLIAIRYDTRPGSLYSHLITGGPQLDVKVWLVRPDGSPLFTGCGVIPGTSRQSSGSAKNDAYLWYIERYMKPRKADPRYAAYYIDQAWRAMPQRSVQSHNMLANHDYFIAHRGFFFDLSPWADEVATDDPTQALGTDSCTLDEMLTLSYKQRRDRAMCHMGGFPAWAFKYTQHAGGRHGDVETEWHCSELISHYNVFKDADAIPYGAMANASFWQHFPLKRRYPQSRTLRRHSVEPNKNYVVIYIGDYDAASWVAQWTPIIWNHPKRGQLPMMWAISPALAARAPHVLHYQRQTASPLDHFVAADNGAGYIMPGIIEDEDRRHATTSRMKAWEKHCQRYYRQWDISITGFIIDGNGPAMGAAALDAYARFSPDGIVPQKCPPASLHNDMPVLRSDWDLVDTDPKKAAQTLVNRIHKRSIPFHWFRCILKDPAWYTEVVAEAQRLDSSIELLDAPTFFHLLREWQKEPSILRDYRY